MITLVITAISLYDNHCVKSTQNDNFGNLLRYAQMLGCVFVFIDTFSALCDKNNISMNKACIEIGISRTSTAKWKNGSVPNGTTLNKIADYFDVSVDYLLGKEDSPAVQPSKLSDDAYRVAAAYDKAEPAIQSSVRKLLDL